MRKFSPALSIIVCSLLLSMPATGQTTTGSIVGTVADTSGGAIPGATVTVTNEGTSITAFKTTTDSGGNYVATPLAIGRYTVTVEATG